MQANYFWLYFAKGGKLQPAGLIPFPLLIDLTRNTIFQILYNFNKKPLSFHFQCSIFLLISSQRVVETKLLFVRANFIVTSLKDRVIKVQFVVALKVFGPQSKKFANVCKVQ